MINCLSFSFQLKDNTLGEKGAAVLSEALMKNSSLTKLDLMGEWEAKPK